MRLFPGIFLSFLSAEVKKRVAEVIGRDARIRALANELLMGVAQSQHEADLALQKLHGIKGVRALKSQLRIVAAKK